MSFFSDAHVNQSSERGSTGPAVGFFDMVQQGFRQQYQVDSQFALDQELSDRWQESLRALRNSGQNFNSPSIPSIYRQYAQFVRDGTAPTPIDIGAAAGIDENYARARFGLVRPRTDAEFEEMRRANEAVRALNNPNIKTFEQILEEVFQMQRGVEEETASMHERGPTGTFFAELLGAAAGSFSLRDPLNIVTAPIGIGRTVATRILGEMAIAAGVVTATELGDVAPNRVLAGLPERNPLFNIAAATVGAGVIRGGIEGIGAGVRGVRGRLAGEDIDFDLRDAQMQQMFGENSTSPTARAASSLLDDTVFIERNNPYGEGRAASERFMAELQAVQRSMNGEPMTAVARVLPPVPFEYIQKAADFEIVREQAPLVYARMEEAQTRLADLRTGNTSFEPVQATNIKPDVNVIKFKRGEIEGELIWREGDTEAGVNIYGEGANTADIAQIRGMLGDVALQYPQLKTLRGVRQSGARAAAPQTVRVELDRAPLSADRRAANVEYQKAYRAVEAEAVRFREQQRVAETAQQRESSNVLAAVSKDSPFVGPLLRYDNVQSLVERLNTINDALDEKAIAAFVRQAEGEAPVREAWLTEDGRVDIGLREPVDPDFRIATDDGEMSVADIMRDLQDDADLVDAVRVCSI